MANYDLKVNSKTLNNINQSVTNYGNELISILGKYKDMMIDLQEYYNTPNGKKIMNVIIEYLSKKQDYVKNYYLPVNDRVKMIINEYEGLYKVTEKTVK